MLPHDTRRSFLRGLATLPFIGGSVALIGKPTAARYLRDETGGRRFWPVKVSRAETDALTRDRHQLFAEAVRAFKAGSIGGPTTKFEARHIRPEQDARYEADVWEDTVAPWVANFSKVSVSEVARECLGFETSRIGTHEQRRIAAILTTFGWASGRDRNGRFYQRPMTYAERDA